MPFTPSLDTLTKTQKELYQYFQPSMQYAWPQLKDRLGFSVIVKHENHLPVGSFKLRGALSYLLNLRKEHPDIKHVVAASRGNFGQGIAFAAHQLGLDTTIIVPKNNSPDKNRAMALLKATIIEHGDDFQAALEQAKTFAESNHAHLIQSYSPSLLEGTASMGLELFKAYPDLDAVYSAIGLGSNICGLVAARNALGLKTKIIGVVSEKISAYADSFKLKTSVSSPTGLHTIADGLDCRVPNNDALELMFDNLEDIITVSESDIAQAMRVYFEDTHNIAEGAGAAPLAGVIKEKTKYTQNDTIGVILCGGNVSLNKYLQILKSVEHC